MFFSLSSSGAALLGDLLRSPAFAADFFPGESSTSTTSSRTETVRIICLDIGTYQPEEITWKVDGEHVVVLGKRCRSIQKGVQGNKFSRVIPIPDGVDAKQISGRFSVGDGLFILEGVKANVPTSKSSKSAYFDDHTATLIYDLGERFKPQELGLSSTSGSNTELDSRVNRKVSLFGDT